MGLNSLSCKYNRQDVLYDLSSFLGNFVFQEKIVDVDKKKYEYIDSAYYLGKNELFSVFEVHHLHHSDARVGLTKQAVEIMKSRLEFTQRAIFFFVPKNSNTFRISLVTFDWANNKPNNPRRYSFLVGEEQKTHTAIQQLSNVASTEDELLKRFSIEVVNDDFYKKISAHFEDLLNQIKYPSVCQQEKQEEAKRNFAVRLIGRLIFCWFLKKKYRLDGSSLIPEELLSSKAAIECSTNYYHDILEPLFFETLNKQPQDRIPKCRVGLLARIPFLNGGLFEAHDPEDGYKYDEKTETCYLGMAITIPNDWFINFFETLETYNFTIDENTSTDIDLAVDPEMLGRIFENLLASINPETKESVRKATGSYYTPREIVDYMVTQSLKQYLYTKTDIDHKVIDSLFEFEPQIATLSDFEKQRIYKALSTAKVLDPAVGSGAFPMGVLQKIMSIIHIIDPKGFIYRDLSDNILTSNFSSKQLDYINKYTLIRDCIYGVDIQPMAIEICRLRFFLTLIVEEESENPKPLPNLNFNFACANSLVGLQQPKQEAELFSQRTGLIEELKRVRKSYFNSSAEEKERLKQKFSEIQTQIWLRTFHTEQRYLIEDSRFKLSKQQAQNKEYADELSSWDPFSYQSNKWFDPFWMFGVENGFDIVIANPPYIESRNKLFSETLKDKLEEQLFYVYGKQRGKFFSRGADLLIFFYEFAIRSISEDGICTFITQNSWLDSDYGKKFQNFLVTHTNILKIIDSDFKHFSTANINTVITIFQGKNPGKEIVYSKMRKNIKTILEVTDCKKFEISDPLVDEYKWGLLWSADPLFLELLQKANNKGSILNPKKNGFDIGQGLNISKNNFSNLQLENYVPIYTVKDGATLRWDNAHTYVDKKLISNLREIPCLILPRGIGRYHYCTYNWIAGYSASYVDIYSIDNNNSKEDILRIWLFCNSSLCWLMRECSGRKNLGGGLLKAEATDLKRFPLYYAFPEIEKIKTLFNKAQQIVFQDTIEEVVSSDFHKEIDTIVNRFLKLSPEEETYVTRKLIQEINTRNRKSRSKAL